MVKPICDITGSWLRNLYIDKKKYWDIDTELPSRYKPELGYVCPSDWRFREDLIWLKYDHMKIAHKWKLRIEE